MGHCLADADGSKGGRPSASGLDSVLAKDTHRRNGVQEDMPYDHLEVEARWQHYWGLHVGHPEDLSRTSALPWLYGIGSNLLLKHRRGEARRLRASARMAAAGAASDKRASAKALDARLLFPRVAGAIEALPDGEREALLLFAWEDLSYQSMAEALELPIGTVRSRLNRARAHLRELLEPKGERRVKPR